MDSVIVLSDSDDEPTTNNNNSLPTGGCSKEGNAQLKRKCENSNDLQSPKNKIRRIAPIKIAEVSKKLPSDVNDNEIEGLEEALDLSFVTEELGDELPNIDLLMPQSPSQDEDNQPSTSSKHNGTHSKKTSESVAIEINETFQAFLDAARAADPSDDMETIINKKVLKYYREVHPDFLISKSFTKTVKEITKEIREIQDPNQVWIKIKCIVDELNVRRKSKHAVITNEEAATTSSNEKNDARVLKLNKALYLLKKKIKTLEEADVEMNSKNDEFTAYIRAEKLKKRALEIYNKICDLTGESKNAQRIVKQPIKFKETRYESFNNRLQSYVNNTQEFPDFLDVLKILDYCNKKDNLKMRKEEMELIARDAFEKLGKKLQSRRKTDLYQTAIDYVGKQAQPEKDDPVLKMKLEENKKYHSKINDLIDRFAKKQETNPEGLEEEESEMKRENDDETQPSTSKATISIPKKSLKTEKSISKSPDPVQSQNSLNAKKTELEKKNESNTELPENHKHEEISVVAKIDAIDEIVLIDDSGDISKVDDCDLNLMQPDEDIICLS